MQNIEALEVIGLNVVEGKLVATISYCDTSKIEDVNDGFNTKDIPVNIRALLVSERGGVLVNQSARAVSDESNLKSNKNE